MGDEEKKHEGEVLRWVKADPALEAWPADDPNAKDPLRQHSLERALADPEYWKKHEAWVMWALAEQQARDAAAKSEIHRITALDQVNATLAAKAAEAEKAHNEATIESDRREREKTTQRRARLAATTVNI